MRLEPVEEPTYLQRTGERRILLVDDETIIRDLCARVLKSYTIFQAADGEQALALLARQPVDLILTDVMMPRLGGLDLLRAIKERDPDQAVVVMTGYADREIILRALKADADDFISKPINLLELQTTIDRVLEKKRLRLELQQLKRSDRLKSDFLGLVSHKLRTPVTAISLFMQNLAGGISNPDDPDFRRTLDLILQESDYLKYLIQDLLHYSEIILQEGPPQRAATSLNRVIASLLASVRSDADAKGVSLRNDVNAAFPPLLLDQQRVDFALRALLDNAIKFTPQGGSVTVSGALTEDELHLIIADTGKGIPSAEIPKVCEKFYQVDPKHTGQVRGFGLGLFYSREFIRSHGGRIQLESEPGHGTTVTVVLPRHFEG